MDPNTVRQLTARHRLLAGLAAGLILAAPAHGAIVREQTVTATCDGSCSPLVTPAIPGGTDQTYGLFIATRSNDDVTTVTGGGLTWSEQIEQCSGREQQGIRLWTAVGSPGAAFTVTITYVDDPDHPIVAILSRYSGVGSLQDPTGENSNGESGACADGVDNDSPQLTLTSTTNDSVHVIGLNHRNEDVLSYSVSYAQIATDGNGTSGDETRMTTYDQTFNPAATDQFQATIAQADEWCTAGIVLSPAPVTAVNYRSIGSAAAPHDSGTDASINAGTRVVTLGSGETFDASVGQGDKLVITGGGGGIVREEFKAGASVTTPATVPTIGGGNNQTYVMFIASRDNADVTSVTGGGLTWTERLEQCGDDSETGTRIWTAQGSPGSAFAAQINYTHSGGNSPLSAVLVRYSGVGPFEDPTGENINGESGSCAAASTTDTAQVTLTSTVNGSLHVTGAAIRGETVSSVSAGYSLVDSASIGSGPNTTRQVVYDGEFDPAATDTFQATLSSATNWAAAGIVLNPGPASSTFHILAVDSTIQATVQETASFGRSNQTYTIERVYAAIDTWEDACDGDLIGENRREVGVCYADSVFTPSSTITIDDSIVDSEHYMTLTVAPGQRHLGVAGSGVLIDGSGHGGRVLVISDDYTVVEWLAITSFATDAVRMTDSPTSDGTVLANLLIYNFTTATRAINMQSDATVRNTVIYDGRTGIRVQDGATGIIENCTIYDMENSGIDGSSTAAGITVRNTIAAYCVPVDMEIDCTVNYFDYNMYATTAGGFPTGANDQTPPALPEDLFISTTPLSENLHLKPSGHTAGNTGLDLSAAFTNDIDDEVRSGAWDIGADEAIPGGGSKPKIVRWSEVEPN
jgi:hypothetical protein